MKKPFIDTVNFQRMSALCEELVGPVLGVEMGAVKGSTGYGKTTSGQRIFATNKNVIYCLYHESWSHIELMREITFRLCGKRPRFRQACFEIIQEEMAERRRIIMIDEADRLSLKCLNVLRNLHDCCQIPVLLIGEEALKQKLEREPRVISRFRTILTFEPASEADIIVFYKKAAGIQIQPEQARKLLKSANGNFRNVIIDAVAIERMMKASSVERVTDRMLDAVCNNVKRFRV